jgi:hypothetical protein
MAAVKSILTYVTKGIEKGSSSLDNPTFCRTKETDQSNDLKKVITEYLTFERIEEKHRGVMIAENKGYVLSHLQESR